MMGILEQQKEREADELMRELEELLIKRSENQKKMNRALASALETALQAVEREATEKESN